MNNTCTKNTLFGEGVEGDRTRRSEEFGLGIEA